MKGFKGVLLGHPCLRPAQVHGSGRSQKPAAGRWSSNHPLPGQGKLLDHVGGVAGAAAAEGRPGFPVAFAIVLVCPGYIIELGTVVLGSVKGTALHVSCSKPLQILQNLNLSSWRRASNERSQPGAWADPTERPVTIPGGF